MAVRITKAPSKTQEAVNSAAASTAFANESEWFSDGQYDGQLAVDVFQTPKAIIVQSAIAGVASDDLDIIVHRDVVTIRGRRKQEWTIDASAYLFQECYWGSFSRSILLPVEIDPDGTTATLRAGILEVTLPKAQRAGARTIRVKNEDLF